MGRRLPIPTKSATQSKANRRIGQKHPLSEFERNLIRERTRAGLRAARRRGKKPGRKRKLTTKDLTAVKAMLRDDGLTVEDIARRVGVSPATLYRHLPGGRSAVA
ncbi:MAG: Hin recombinase [bacterium]|nr:Hin recombinase [bacterium]